MREQLPIGGTSCYYKSQSECFYLKHGKMYVRILIVDIHWIQADGSSIEIITQDDTYNCFTSLRSFLEQIEHPNLLQVHRSYIVNLSKVESYDDAAVYMNRNGTIHEIPVARRERKDLMERIVQLKTV